MAKINTMKNKNKKIEIPYIAMPVVGNDKSITDAAIKSIRLTAEKRITSIGCAKIYNTKKDILLEKYQKSAASLKVQYERGLESIEKQYQEELAHIDSSYK
ncbi:MAG: hypothetical protein LBV53_02585 [Mycoplasmataceae bacterium]|jgi:hypothetical protein|nr:hypothetical protein [Mycoplasmataceae bacterium]